LSKSSDHSAVRDNVLTPSRRLNINLLYALHALLHEPTLTEAAAAISVSQPAMSVKLRQLREHFDDELVLFGESERFTALGMALKPRVGSLLREVDDTFNLCLSFDPASARRTITITAPEVVELMFISRLVPQMRAVAPGITLEIMPFVHGSSRQLFDAGADIAIVPEAMVDSDLCTQFLFEHGPAALVWDRHPLAGQPVSDQEYLAARHAAVHPHMEHEIFGNYDSDQLLAQRNIAVRTGLHSMLPALAIGSDLIVTTSNWFAQHQAACLPVTLLDLASPMPSTALFAQWQPYRGREPLIRWLLEELDRAVASIGP